MSEGQPMDPAGAATTRDAPAVKPPRTWRPMILWTAAILAAMGLTWLLASVVIPVTHACLIANRFHAYVQPPGDGTAPEVADEMKRVVRQFGGQRAVAARLRLYLKLPSWLADRNQKREAALLLAGCGEPGALALLDASDTDPDCLRGDIVLFLSMVPDFSDPNTLEQPAVVEAGLPRLESMLDNDDLDICQRATVILGSMGPPAIPLLEKALENRESFIRGRAAEALGRIGPDAKVAIPALIAVVGRRDFFAQSAAARTLGQMGPLAIEAVPALRKALQDEDQRVRTAAAEALKKTRGEEAGK